MLPYQHIMQPTLRPTEGTISPDRQHSTPKYVLKVPIPQLQNLSAVSHHQIPSFSGDQGINRSSGHKENNQTFDQRHWNQDSSEKKGILAQSAKKINTEMDEASSIVEKSFTEAAQKIMKIKNLELENKVSLLVIENERLTTFLNDQFQENEKLTQDFLQAQQSLQDLSKNYDDKLNIVLMENEKLQQINSSLVQKNDSLQVQRKYQQTDRDDEIKQLKEELANKIKNEKNWMDQQKKQEQGFLENQIGQLNYERKEMEQIIIEFQEKIKQQEIDLKLKDSKLIDFNNIQIDLASKIQTIEIMGQTIVNQENRINDLENRLDYMVNDNKQLQDVNEQFNHQQRSQQNNLEDIQIRLNKELQQSKEFYDNEVKMLNQKHKHQLEELKFQQQDQYIRIRNEIENEMLKELENLRIELEGKQNELTNQTLLWKEKERDLLMHNEKEIEIKDQINDGLKSQIVSLNNQMEQVQTLVNRMSQEFEITISQKESEIVKLTKSLHQKDQNQKQQLQKLDEIFKQVKILEEQRDELSQEITNSSLRNQDLEQRLDIMIKENETLTVQSEITQQQLDLVQRKYETLEKTSQQRLEDAQFKTNLDTQVQLEQCITQYQAQIKFEQDKQEQIAKNLKKQQEKTKHQELLYVQSKKDNEKLSQRIGELVDACEQSGNKSIELESLLKQKNAEIKDWSNKFVQVQEQNELQFATLKKQMMDIGLQNEDALMNQQHVNNKLKQQEQQNKKIMQDLTDLTKQKLDLEQMNKKYKNQLKELESQNNENYKEAQKYKSQVYQHQQEIEELTRSQQQNYSEKEYELQNKYDQTIGDLKGQLNLITNKYNDLARKERDNRFRLKLLKSNSQIKLPSDLEDEDCYDNIKRKLEDQSEYLKRLIFENEELKQQIFQNTQLNKQQSKKAILVKHQPQFFTTEDTERTIKQQRQEPTMIQQSCPQYASAKKISISNQKTIDPKQFTNTNRFLDRDVYLGQQNYNTNNTNTRKDLRFQRQSSLQKI